MKKTNWVQLPLDWLLLFGIVLAAVKCLQTAYELRVPKTENRKREVMPKTENLPFHSHSVILCRGQGVPMPAGRIASRSARPRSLRALGRGSIMQGLGKALPNKGPWG